MRSSVLVLGVLATLGCTRVASSPDGVAGVPVFGRVLVTGHPFPGLVVDPPPATVPPPPEQKKAEPAPATQN